ncbi:hypothetical protein FQN55_004474 [Onygenales sp. PD_40]|nr:hypothetical protein FQN55_004474 [Onygenales sp. PD_40]
MPSRSPSRSRSPSPLRSQGRPRSQSPEQSHLPRRSYSPRSRRSDVSRSRSRSRTPRSVHDRRNGDRDERVTSRSPSRSRSLSRSVSRGRSDRRYRDRSYTRSPSRGTPRTSSKIVVEKLTKNVNENHLREIFGTYGEIRSLELPMNPQFMTNRGTAYILYYEAADAEAAISHMHEAQLDGAVLNVSIVLPLDLTDPLTEVVMADHRVWMLGAHLQVDIVLRRLVVALQGVFQVDVVWKGMICTAHVRYRGPARHVGDLSLIRRDQGLGLPLRGDGYRGETARPAGGDENLAIVAIATAMIVAAEAELEAGVGVGIATAAANGSCEWIVFCWLSF